MLAGGCDSGSKNEEDSMKHRTWFSVLFWLAAGAGLSAQTLTTLHGFTGTDGAVPYTGLILVGNTLYGTATMGGSSGNGTVFSVNTDGKNFTVLHDFMNSPEDGAAPWGGLVLGGNTLYGTTMDGGTSGNGTVFSINTDGSGFTILHSFSATTETNYIPGNEGYPLYINTDGTVPHGDLILESNKLIGNAFSGGSGGYGTIFTINTDGTGFTNLHNFMDGSDGANPMGGVILAGNSLFGATEGVSYEGGSNSVVFAMNTDGTSFTVLHHFTPTPDGTNLDGVGVESKLLLAGNTLYGTADGAGAWESGTVFAVNSDGTGFAVLHTFSTAVPEFETNGDGAFPGCTLIIAGNTLYGTAPAGGSSGCGTLFSVNTDGTGFTNLYTMTGGTDGAGPYGGLLLTNHTLYGTATEGGTTYNGTVFAFTLPPPTLKIFSAGNQNILSWPASADDYVLQTTTNLSTPNWLAVSNAMPVTNFAPDIAVAVSNNLSTAYFRLQSSQ